MPKRMLIDAAHAEETRVVVLDGKKLEEFDFESSTKKQLKGNIYLAKVTRVEPSLQAAFLDYGGNRHGFLPFSEIHPDYYQIPVADRQALLSDEAQQVKDEDSVADEASEAKSRNSEKSDNGDANGEDTVESLGHDDELEEVRAPRSRPRRHYKIQEVIKRRQIMLVQVVREERGNKGAALTTYMSLAGRYCVLMPNTSRGGGVSRKIANPADRKRLKGILADLEMPEGVACIIRTAGTKRTKPEIKRDYEYLLRLWDTTRQLTLKSMAPALIYEEGNLIKRSIRDIYTREIDEVQVEGEAGYRMAKDFMRLLMPSHSKKVQHYTDRIPLFHRYQVEGQLDSMFNPTVELRSGGYIVINPTEALVAVDVNSGRSTREHNIEETAYKTNLEAAEEIARQLRLRDMAGLVVIDFIDMEDNRNNRNVEKKMKDCLKADRARIQVGRISHFGLMELSRQRLRPGVLEASTRPCEICQGTGVVRSIESCSLQIIRVMEEEGIRGRSAAVNVFVPVPVALFLLNEKRRYIAQLEDRFDLEIRVQADPSLLSPNYNIERVVRTGDEETSVEAVKMDSKSEEPQEAEVVNADEQQSEQSEESRSKRRRRRRRRRGGNRQSEDNVTAEAQADDQAGAEAEASEPQVEETAAAAPAEATPEETVEEGDGAKKPRRRRSRSRKKTTDGESPAAAETAEEAAPVTADTETPETVTAKETEAAPEKAPRKRTRRKAKPKETTEETAPESVEAAAPTEEVAAGEPPADEEEKPKKRRAPRRRKPAKAEEEPAKPDEEPAAPTPKPETEEPEEPEEPKETTPEPPAEDGAPGADDIPLAPSVEEPVQGDIPAPLEEANPPAGDTGITPPDEIAEPKPASEPAPESEPEPASEPEPEPEPKPEPAPEQEPQADEEPTPEQEPEAEAKPKKPARRGWWQRAKSVIE